MPTPASRLLFKQAHAAAEELGWPLRETAVGGASDGDFVSALGCPVLDGLGAVCDGAHARHEHVLLDHLPGARHCWPGSSWRGRCSRTRLSNPWTPSRGLA
ncbi:M20/M25/M40 family metallo-hydrolase [Streptomyces coeruleorubidus]|uniref:M20/M25/M40 family metallo-hydrolase n=1 Tax=Streptomyces coeruleorubidus TaxID=116188 RepID=UPI0033B5DA76